MRTRLFFSFTLLFVCLCANGQADSEMTSYELKREQLATQALEKISNAMSTSDQLSFSLILASIMEKNEGDRFAQTAAKEKFISMLFDFGDLFKAEAEYWYKPQSSLSYYDARQIKGWSEIGNWYKTNRIALEKERTENDANRELERVKYNRGVGLLHKTISQRFSRWAERGELEKSAVYSKRLNEKASAAFDSICFSACKEAIKKNVAVQKIGYDPDEEIYKIAWSIIGDNDNILCTRNSSFHVSINEIAELQNDRHFMHNLPYYADALGIGEYDGYIFPTRIKFKFEGNRKIASFDGVEPLSISGQIINNPELAPYISSHHFDLTSFLEKNIPYGDVDEMIDQIRKQVYDAYHSFNGNSYNPRSFDYDGKPFYSIEKAEELKAKYRLQLATELYGWFWHVYPYFPELNDVLEDIYSLDMNKLDERMLAYERQVFAEAAHSFKEDQLKHNLSNVDLLKDLCGGYFNSFNHKRNSQEALSKIVIENNEYLNKKIKVKNSYFEALYSYYKQREYR